MAGNVKEMAHGSQQFSTATIGLVSSPAQESATEENPRNIDIPGSDFSQLPHHFPLNARQSTATTVDTRRDFTATPFSSEKSHSLHATWSAQSLRTSESVDNLDIDTELRRLRGIFERELSDDEHHEHQDEDYDWDVPMPI